MNLIINTQNKNKKHLDRHLECMYLWVEVRLYLLQNLIHLGESSGWELTVDGTVWADTADSHIHISAVHLDLKKLS